MRNTDSDSSINRAPLKPLGEKIDQPKQAPSTPAQKPQGRSGIVTDKDGRMKTTTHPTWSY